MSDHYVLISYSSADQHLAEKVVKVLRSKNINYWIGFENIRPTESWPSVISEAINKCEIFLLILSRHSNNSRQVVRELTKADNLDKKLYCFQVDNVAISNDIQYFFSSIHRHEAFKSDLDDALEKMSDELNKWLVLDRKKTDLFYQPNTNISSVSDGIIESKNENREEIEASLEKVVENYYSSWIYKNKRKILVLAGIGLVIILIAVLLNNSKSTSNDVKTSQTDSSSFSIDSISMQRVDTGATFQPKMEETNIVSRQSKTENSTDNLNGNEISDEKIFEKVEVEASFPGGELEWRKYLERNLNPNTPVDNGSPEGTYTVYVQFVVSKNGSLSDVKALTNHGYGMEQEAVRVFKKGPKWVPAIQNGRRVNAYRKQPITFRITSE